jgi:Cof subfamily protein (haloacid dehalogenase superfamily)
MIKYKLAALDLDGTLFDNQSRITEENITEIRRVCATGAYVVISTGRPFCGLPFSQIEGTGIEYAITTNGSSIYHIPGRECIYEDSMPPEMVLPIMDYLLGKDIHFDVFIDGEAYSPVQCVGVGEKLPMPPKLKEYVLGSRIRIPDMPAYIRENHLRVQKITMNFYHGENGELIDREEVRQYFARRSDVTCVSGGYNNLEFTSRDANKGNGLRRLAEYLGIPMSETIAIGDTENDLAILGAAGLGIAMGNATDAVKAAAGDITLTNEESGVAAALRKYF